MACIDSALGLGPSQLHHIMADSSGESAGEQKQAGSRQKTRERLIGARVRILQEHLCENHEVLKKYLNLFQGQSFSDLPLSSVSKIFYHFQVLPP